MKKAAIITLLLLIAAFVFGLARLFHLRFEGGDVYPEYSSLRADPLGTKALFDSLGSLLDVRRNYRPLPKLDGYERATMLFLGVNARDLECEPAEYKAVNGFVRRGGRLVIALMPGYNQPRPAPPRPPGANKLNPDAPDPISLTNEWKFSVGYASVLRDNEGTYLRVRAAVQGEFSDLGLPESIDMHTALFFENPSSDWQVIYERQGNRPVLMERKLGSGTIVLAADPYYFSNEALLKARESALLSWFVGGNRRVVFDETHLGVTESPGLAALARKYRLHGFVGGLLVLALLFVWQNSSSLIPRVTQTEDTDSAEVISGRDSAAGLINVVRRNIRKQDLLKTCLDQWKHTSAHQTSASKLEQIQRVIDEDNAREHSDPLRVYRAISGILQRKFDQKTR